MERYVAFISYSQRDRPNARWLHRKIEGYRVPARLRSSAREFGGVRGRLAPVFLDREELSSSPDLAGSVRTALDASRFLIVVCSPHAAASRWVNEEIAHFKALGRADRMLCLVVSGEPGASRKGNAAEECFPPALLVPGPDGKVVAEPLAADLRPGMDEPRDALLKIVAALLGLRFDDLRRREQSRRQKRLAALAAALAAGCVVLTGLTAAAVVARNEAQRQRLHAEKQSLTARRTADFMKSLFEVSDPGEARGSSITAREILDRGARQIDSGLGNEPLVRAELTTTLGEVYTSLGLYRTGAELLTKARNIGGQSAEARARQALALAQTEFLVGHYESADELFASALGTIASANLTDPALQMRALTGRAETLSEMGRDETAVPLFERSMELAIRQGPEARDALARNIEGLAAAAWHAGRISEADEKYRRALDIRLQLTGERHPKVAEELSALGAIAYMAGKNDEAEAYFLRALPIYRRVSGERHPDVAMTLNNLARIRVERRQFREAAPLLQESAEINLAQKDETNDNMAFVYSNLALVHMESGEYAAAVPLYEKALRAAVANNHRLHGPILTDFGDLDCRMGRFHEGLRRLDDARPLVTARYPNDVWRAALIDNVRGECLLGLKRFDEAAPLLTDSMGALLKKWGKDGLYGADAVRRSLKLAEYRSSERRRPL
jgi:tetratricopeptide (TPR) repeat protein